MGMLSDRAQATKCPDGSRVRGRGTARSATAPAATEHITWSAPRALRAAV